MELHSVKLIDGQVVRSGCRRSAVTDNDGDAVLIVPPRQAVEQTQPRVRFDMFINPESQPLNVFFDTIYPVLEKARMSWIVRSKHDHRRRFFAPKQPAYQAAGRWLRRIVHVHKPYLISCA